jgi:hypothetical protein
MIFQASGNWKQAEVAMLIYDKKRLQAKIRHKR